MTDVLFRCDASPQHGFGHLARCLQLGRMLSEKGFRVWFQGHYSEGAQHRIEQNGFSGSILSIDDQRPMALAIYDTMDNTEDPQIFDLSALQAVAKRSTLCVFMANGLVAPNTVPSNTMVIGYKPSGQNSIPPMVQWGLEFAPTDIPQDILFNPRKGSLLIALGGGQGNSAMLMALDVVAGMSSVHHVDILQSPVGDYVSPEGRLAAHQTFREWSRLPSVFPLIAGSELVLCSYGHFAYEAMALGAGVCVVGQKPFQAEYGALLEKAGFAVNAGLLSTISPEALFQALRKTSSGCDERSSRATAQIARCDLQRVVDAVLTALNDIEVTLK